MFTETDLLIQNRFELSENEGKDKTVSLDEAVRSNIKPGMTLHIAVEANAAINEIIRAFYGKQPGFTLIMPGVIGVALNLIYCRLIKKVITSNYSFLAPFIAPIAIAQNAYKNKSVEFEDWSLCTIAQRLMAGALGLPFMPTKSIIGSTMEKENKETFMVLPDPFESGKDVALVKSLNPDIAVVHAWAADRFGNTIVSPASPAVSWDSHLWGAKASKNGVVVTVENIVSTDFIRDHSSFVKLPGYMVKSVSLAPMGAHPVSFISSGIDVFEGYGDDYDFIVNYKKVSKDPELLDPWLKEWIFDPDSHDDYLQKIGSEKLKYLKKQAKKGAWRSNLKVLLPQISDAGEANSIETMVVMASRKIKDSVRENGYKIMLAGAGLASLASWLAYYKLKNTGIDVELSSGSGIFGFAPRPSDSFFASIYNIPYCKILTDTLDIYGVMIGRTSSSAVSILGAGQIDKYGNVNSTRIGDRYITGSGGSNDAANANEVIIVADQSSKRFVEKVPYITFPGKNVTTLISSMGIFEKHGKNNEFVLTEYFPVPELSQQDDIIKRINDNCGWEVKVSKDIKVASIPEREELMELRALDPKRVFIKPDRTKPR